MSKVGRKNTKVNESDRKKNKSFGYISNVTFRYWDKGVFLKQTRTKYARLKGLFFIATRQNCQNTWRLKTLPLLCIIIMRQDILSLKFKKILRETCSPKKFTSSCLRNDVFYIYLRLQKYFIFTFVWSPPLSMRFVFLSVHVNFFLCKLCANL